MLLWVNYDVKHESWESKVKFKTFDETNVQ